MDLAEIAKTLLAIKASKLNETDVLLTKLMSQRVSLVPNPPQQPIEDKTKEQAPQESSIVNDQAKESKLEGLKSRLWGAVLKLRLENKELEIQVNEKAQINARKRLELKQKCKEFKSTEDKYPIILKDLKLKEKEFLQKQFIHLREKITEDVANRIGWKAGSTSSENNRSDKAGKKKLRVKSVPRKLF